MAFFDMYNFYDELTEGDVGLAIMYVSSAISGLWAFFIFSGFISAIPGVDLGLLALALTLSVLIENLKDNALQEWMERCFFGKKHDAIYSNMEN